MNDKNNNNNAASNVGNVINGIPIPRKTLRQANSFTLIGSIGEDIPTRSSRSNTGNSGTSSSKKKRKTGARSFNLLAAKETPKVVYTKENRMESES